MEKSQVEQVSNTNAKLITDNDTLNYSKPDPKTKKTALPQDSTPLTPSKKGECELNFILLANPTKNQHVFQVKGFDAGNFKCWIELEAHGIKLCGDNMPCDISYVDISDITKTSNPPYNIDGAQLKKNGIGHFAYKNSWWELRGAKIWNRPGKGYEYYNSNRY